MPNTSPVQTLPVALMAFICAGGMIAAAASVPRIGLAPIVGGGPVAIQQLPYMVSIQNKGVHYCSGSILNQHRVLTSASCVSGMSFFDTTIRVGTATPASGGSVCSVAGIAIHPEYDASGLSYDVAVLQLADAIALSATVRAITIAEEGQELVQGDLINVAGWGVNDLTTFMDSDTLQAVWVRVLLRKLCKIAYAGSFVIGNQHICGGVAGKGSCINDQGGPVVGEDGKQYGVISSSGSCGSIGYPDVYINLGDKTVRDWVIGASRV